MSRSIQLYKICEKGGKITFYLIFLGIASLLYLPDMVDKYQKKATTFTTVTEQVKNEKVDLGAYLPGVLSKIYLFICLQKVVRWGNLL